jgi:hypothetical protein
MINTYHKEVGNRKRNYIKFIAKLQTELSKLKITAKETDIESQSIPNKLIPKIDEICSIL